MVFGIDVADDGDEIMAIVEDALEWIGETFTPGKYFIDVLPILQHVPTWFPGATVQRLIVKWRATVVRLKEEPYRRVKAAMVSAPMHILALGVINGPNTPLRLAMKRPIAWSVS